MNRTRGFVTVVAAIILGVWLPTNSALAGGFGVGNQSGPSTEWWQWALSIPSSVNPLLDTTGDQCMVGQHGSTFFLAGSWVAGPVTRDCDIPQTASLFFPVINEINFDTPGQCGQGAALSAAYYRTLSKAFVDGAANMSVTLDGHSVGPVRRIVSPVFEVALPEDNIFGGACAPDLTDGIYSPAVDDGYYVKLNPLAVGSHTLHIHAEQPSAGFVLDVTYHLNVVPVVTH